VILHICPRAEWSASEGSAIYRPATLDEIGFVHCSDPGTVHLPANRLYPGRRDLLLLELDESALGAPLRWEPGVPPVEGGPWFPHVYGPIPRAAVLGVHEFPPEEDGRFRLPRSLAER
jgi:uncharacterized protein (DUF952 family)